MRNATLVYLLNNQDQILLCTKKRGFGLGKVNGIWGKVKDWENILVAALRELEEESMISLTTDDVEQVGLCHFFWPHKPERDVNVYIFVGKYEWEFEESEEVRPERYDTDNLPYELMRPNDVHFVPRLVNGEKGFEYEFVLDAEWQIISYQKFA